MKKALLLLYPLLTFVLLIYSYTQVDLNLTLFRVPIWLSFQRWSQNIGYFQRPLSTLIFLVIFVLLFIFYFGFLKFSKQFSKKEIWTTIILSSIILSFSYNAFSYDFFNYIFDAKIFTFYHQNPYLHRALDFPKDPMLLFMHWTHRLYPYGALWLGLTIPLSFAAKGLFLPAFFMLKFLISAFFLGTIYFIQKVIRNVSPKDENFGILFFALNPLVVAETLVSSHNDTVMMFFAVLAFYLLFSRKIILSSFSLILSILIKFATIFLIPVWAIVLFSKRKQDFGLIIFYSIILMFLAVLAATFRLEFQPWYWLYVLPLIALIPRMYNLYIAGIVVSAFSLFNYVPFLYNGNWDAPAPSIIFWTTTLSILISIFIIVRKLGKI